MNDFYYRKVDAYQLAKEMASYIYQLLRKYPQEERYALIDQTRRAAISIPANIAEGLGRFAIKERIHFLDIAYGSLTEVLCELEIAFDNRYISEDEFNKAEQLATRISLTIYGLKKSLEEKNKMRNLINNHE